METHLKIDGMHCDACVRRLRKALEKLQGAEILEVSVGTVRVQGAPRAEVEATVVKAGYTVAS